MDKQKFDGVRVNAAVKISLAILRVKDRKKSVQLYKDLARIQESMTTEEYNEYLNRTN